MSNTPVRLRHFNKTTKSKAIIDVYWSNLRGNKAPYLSVSIVDVIVNGERVHSWDEQKRAISGISSELGFLVSKHLADKTNGHGIHNVANASHHLGLLIDCLGGGYTESDRRDDLRALAASVGELPESLVKHLGPNASEVELKLKKLACDSMYIAATYNRLNSRALYLIDHMVSGGFWSPRSIKRSWSTYFEKFMVAQKERLKLEKRPAIADRDYWTPVRFSEYYNIPLNDVKGLVFSQDRDILLTDYLETQADADLIELNELTIKHSIPTLNK